MILFTVILLSALWIYWDAINNKIGKIEGRKSFDNLSAGAWYFFSLILWVITFPYYLLKRKKLIELAKDNPIITNRASLKFSIIAVFNAFIFLPVLLIFIEEKQTVGHQNEKSSNTEQILSGINLASTKDEILSSYSNGLNQCRVFDGKDVCFWRKGQHAFHTIYFYNNRISQIEFSRNPTSLQKAIIDLSTLGRTPIIEPIKSGSKVDENTVHLINRGATVIDFDKMILGDVLLLGCRAYIPFYNGKLKFLGLGGQNFFIRGCTDNVFEILMSDDLIYESTEFTETI